jgi:hypothetical protein
MSPTIQNFKKFLAELHEIHGFEYTAGVFVVVDTINIISGVQFSKHHITVLVIQTYENSSTSCQYRIIFEYNYCGNILIPYQRN